MVMKMSVNETRKVNAEIGKCVERANYALDRGGEYEPEFWMFKANLLATLYYLGDYDNAEEVLNDWDLILKATYNHEVVYLMKHNNRDEMCETCPYCPDFPIE